MGLCAAIGFFATRTRAAEQEHLGKALPSKVPAEHKKHVENMVKKLSQIAADLDKSGDASDQAKTEANLKKLDALLKEMEDMVGPGEAVPHQH